MQLSRTLLAQQVSDIVQPKPAEGAAGAAKQDAISTAMQSCSLYHSITSLLVQRIDEHPDSRKFLLQPRTYISMRFVTIWLRIAYDNAHLAIFELDPPHTPVLGDEGERLYLDGTGYTSHNPSHMETRRERATSYR